MSKTITGGLAYRKRYALNALMLSPSPRGRGFDNCFEMGDGKEVVLHIMKAATKPLPQAELARARELIKTEGLMASSPEFKLIAQAEKQERLLWNLRCGGHYEPWLTVMNNHA